MKLVLQSLLLLFISVSLQAQLTYSPDPVKVEGNDKDKKLEKFFTITNTGGTTESFYWALNTNASPSEWEFQVCDMQTCYDVGVLNCPDGRPNNLAKGLVANMFIYVYPNEVMGSQIVNLDIISVADSTILTTVPVQVNIDMSSANENLLAQNLALYPNPTSDYFKIDGDQNIKEVSIFNVIGKKIRTEAHKRNQSHDVSDLDKGLYLVRMINDSSKVVKVLRLNIN